MPRYPFLRAVLCLNFFAACLTASSVLSHEAVIDATWDSTLRPVLQAAYPSTTPDDLKRAHGFAYGGAIIQDLGYYPHGNKEFSDMTHYIRTGAFVLALVRDAESLNELAFALGALSHYSSDIDVHSFATNPGEAILYPKLRIRFGPVVYYEQDPAAHLKTEFGFDVLEVAKGRFAPAAYHDFIGFYVANDLVARAFRDTYGLELTDIFGDFPKAIGSYRRDVSIWIPRATRIAWAQRRDEIERSQPTVTRRKFVYVMRRAAYEHDWGKDYTRPSLPDRILGLLLKLLPPIGPLGSLRLRMPTPDVENLFMASFNRAIGEYQGQVRAEQARSLTLGDPNYDIGHPAKPGEYRLEDKAYAYWVDRLAAGHFAHLTESMRRNILSYYADSNAPIATKKKRKEWLRLESELQQLKAAPAAQAANGSSAPPDLLRRQANASLRAAQ